MAGHPMTPADLGLPKAARKFYSGRDVLEFYIPSCRPPATVEERVAKMLKDFADAIHDPR